MEKRLYKIGIACYIILLVLAIVFYKERTIFIDIAYHLFFITKDSAFAIQNFRFGAAVTQIFPLLSVKLGLPLEATAVIYSAGFAVYYFTCYLICGSLLKQYKYALIVLLLSILFVSDTFYWIQSELPQGLAFMITMMALGAKEKPERSPLAYAAMFLMMLTVAFFHPLIVFPFMYILLFLLNRKTDKPANKLLYALFFFFMAVVVLKRLFFSSVYDKTAMSGLANFATRFPYIRLYANKHFALYCLSHFYWLPVFSIAIVAMYAVKKNWKAALLYIVFFGGYLLIVNVSFPGRGTTALYIENLYLPLGIFIAFPLVFDLLPVMAAKKMALPVFVLIVLSGVARIYFSHEKYTARLNWERNLLVANKNKKLVIDAKKAPADTLVMTWGTPYEFWLLSTIETGKTASIIISERPDELAWALNNPKGFLTTWGDYQYADLPVKYFHFTDTTSGYSMTK